MPQRLNEQVQNTFIQGLITERAELTFPENASIDESNCELLRTGARRRRLGLIQESGGELSTETNTGITTVFSVSLWENVNEVGGKNYVVIQSGSLVKFYENTDSALSANRVKDDAGNEITIDLQAYVRPASGVGASVETIEVASVKGSLIIASSEISTILVERSTVDGTFSVSEISFKVRDYDWQGDQTTYSESEPVSSITDDRIYDTKNTGWSDGPNGVGDSALTTYTGGGNYPPLTHPWYSGKNSSGVFNVGEWEKIYAGSTLITNGHYVYDLYSKVRSAKLASGNTAVDTVEDSRFSTVASYASRVFYSGMKESTDDNGSKIFFTPILEQGTQKVGTLHQINDPTSEELSDLLDTDGGFIYIPDAGVITKLHSFGPDLYIFTNRGVWRVSGVDDVFRASEYSVSKLSNDGILTKESFVDASGRPYWWSAGGIYTVSADEATGQVIPQNLSISTIQTYYTNIGALERAGVQGTYDDVNRRVIWAYPSAGNGRTNRLNEFLVFDENLTAWTPWSISDEVSNSSYVVGLAFTNGTGQTTLNYNVVDSDSNNVVDSLGNNVVVQRTGAGFFSSAIKVLYQDSTGAISFAEFNGTDFLDWGTADYTSYAEAGYNFLGSSLTNKNVPYIVTYMKTTETGWTDNGDGSYTETRGSSLLLSSKWDFRKIAASAQQECYRLKYTTVVDEGDLGSFNYPETVVQTRLKVRGRGRAMVLRWDSSTGKDFHLLGWGLLSATNDRV